MLNVEGVLVSDDIGKVEFACHLAKCKGACCVEGELGAPLEMEELPILDSIVNKIRPYLTHLGLSAIQQQGNYVLDEDGEFSTPIVGRKECAYAVYGKHGELRCGIEQAYFSGKITFRKPISCHLYPIRVVKRKHLEMLTYHKWFICASACGHGERLQTPLYVFLKAPLTRKYGPVWYEKLLKTISSTRTHSERK